MNRLAGETSPYLRQHAANPVDWYPWGNEAFETARSRDVPILLSVGYSACHWCHVMAHESFEDPSAAQVVNDGFVAVKVDREERPDVDSVYMEAVQAVNGSGGWPMTVFLLPDGRPFHGGTYYPRTQFVELLRQVGRLWQERRPDLEAAASSLSDAVRRGTGVPSPGLTGEPVEKRDLLGEAADALLARFDPEWGGFGAAPKFPQPPMLELLLAAHARTGRTDVLDAAVTTLDAMASGGIYDHLGGGFARYSTDRHWLVPHFEKMLYDNALLSRVYLHAWQLTGVERYRQVVAETLDYLLTPPMRLAVGGFASAEDADSEGEEGRFYVWDPAEVRQVGGDVAWEWYGVTEGGNWEGHAILCRPVRGDLLRPPEVEAARARLLARRQARIRPGLDEKVLTEWNAMAVSALADAGAALGRTEWVDAALDTASFLLGHLRRPDGRWLRAYQTPYLAYSADHAWLVDAFTRLAEATGEARWIAEARAAADVLLELFWDADAGAFDTSGSDGEILIARPKDTYDGALPSANSTAATALARLGALTGEPSYQEHARAVVETMRPVLDRAPVAFTGLLVAADLLGAGSIEVAVTGRRPDLLLVARSGWRPQQVLAWGEPYSSPLWTGREGPEMAGLAFVCRQYACDAPVSDPAALKALLGGTGLQASGPAR